MDLECDVAVVGSGGGALAGAYTAASNGLRTVVLEKTALFGGTSAYSGAGLFLPGNQAEARAGVVDSVDRGRTYLRAVLGDGDDPRREAYLRTAPELVEFLERDPLLRFRYFSFPDYFAVDGRLPGGGHIVPAPLPSAELDADLLALLRPTIAAERNGVDVPRDTLGGGQALIGRLLLALRRTGNAELRTGACVERLVVEGGRVVGVQAHTDDGPLRVRAARGVLLAAGGFEGNAALRAACDTPGRPDWTMGPRGTNTGEPIEAAVAIGAATDLMDEAWWCPALVQPDGSAAFFLGLRGGIFVDRNGERFANESLPYDRMGRVLAADPATRIPCHFVFDSREGGQLPAINCVPGAPRAQYLASGAWVRAETLEELAGLTGVPAGALRDSVERFNGFAETGVDEQFHRGEDEYDRYFAAPSDAPNPCLVPLGQPPYHAARVVLGDLGTKGGLRTDADARVLRTDGSAIDGLYAAGNTSASVMGRHYPAPGSPIGTAMVFAYRAARHLAG
ncbi:FAD-binding protein [Jatrophihabitans cynanchi]|jgi:3-oxosteroid 1-dehydrogenase|uniref:FAD-binding protein n=1 Tax=Jatrophihabitans cynanchi TaxID=2944128 RepID=A0ABY7JV00_9ACTN|nr:FAD-binding protein [Jatrophihabitans sp. SB3-54]WAX56363.1 FAD-binding protein [Jatrophihabitans sp. SB3-54]